MLSKERVKKFPLFFKACYEIIFMKERVKEYFFVNKGFDFVFKQWWISIIAYLCFVCYTINKYIQNYFIKTIYFFVNIFIEKCFLPVNLMNLLSDKLNICIFVMPDLSINLNMFLRNKLCQIYEMLCVLLEKIILRNCKKTNY